MSAHRFGPSRLAETTCFTTTQLRSTTTSSDSSTSAEQILSHEGCLARSNHYRLWTWMGGGQKRRNAHPNYRFPSDSEEELSLRYRLLQAGETDSDRIFQLGIAHDADKLDGWIALFRSLIVRPFAEDLSRRLGDAADLATPEARALQAVPLNRIPGTNEIKIFLSHKSIDKPVVYRYDHALRTLGFDPWLDETAMTAGAHLEREVLRGFEESCAAVFFITASYKDEKYLAAEVDYAIMQKAEERAEVRDRDLAIPWRRSCACSVDAVHLQRCR